MKNLRRSLKCSVLLFGVSVVAMADPAPDWMRGAKVEKDAYLQSMPAASVKLPPGVVPFSDSFIFHFSGGKSIDGALALDANVEDSSDPRYVEGNTTCSAYIVGPSMPSTGVMPSRPLEGSSTTEFESGKTITLQSIKILFEAKAADNSINSNMLVCYKVGKLPFTVRDLKAALGAGFKIELSQKQSAAMAAAERARKILGDALSGDSKSAQPSPSPKVAESSDPKKVEQPAKKPADAVVGRSNSGDFGGPNQSAKSVK